MRFNRKISQATQEPEQGDPREQQGAQIIDLATRNVLPAVAQRKPGRDGLAMFSGIVVVGMLGALTLLALDSTRRLPAEKVRPGDAARGTPGADPAKIEVAPAVAPQVMTPPASMPDRVLAAPPQSAVLGAPAGNPAASPTVIFDTGIARIGPNTDAASLANPMPGGVPVATGNGNDDFASRIGGVGGGSAVASASFDPRTTVTQGTLIPAVLETAIDTDVPGYVRAVVSTDVRSFDGSTVLVPRSSRLIGQYKSGLQAGQKRAYVIWTRLIRPDGVSVNIGSPAIGFAGESGLSGKVSTHFFERFGSAVLLSVIGGLSALGGNASVIVAGGGQSAAAAAVGQSGQIGPTVRVRQGQPVRVFTAKDLDFSKATSR
jgi:type IV secretion system protein VirB10